VRFCEIFEDFVQNSFISVPGFCNTHFWQPRVHGSANTCAAAPPRARWVFSAGTVRRARARAKGRVFSGVFGGVLEGFWGGFGGFGGVLGGFWGFRGPDSVEAHTLYSIKT
jgi:hypothetical protein